MIPISDEIPTRRLPIVTFGLIGINVLVFLFELMLGSGLDAFFMRWGAVPAYITDPFSYPLAPLTLVTSMFLHGGWMHLIGNMLYLWIFGDNVEDRLGPVLYAIFYLGAGLVAGLAQVVVAPYSTIPAIGASGAVAGVLAAYLALFPTAPVRVLVPGLFMMRVARVPAVIVLGMWFVIQLFNGFLSLGAATMATGGVAWFAHIGGFVAGLGVGIAMRVFQRPQLPPPSGYYRSF
ncbi:MAG: rhomboid family intramembrane serine protease [Anaerolineae bacterium]|nr:rhomboid family intramembrane serine protease [Anaerolineae bacterium]